MTVAMCVPSAGCLPHGARRPTASVSGCTAMDVHRDGGVGRAVGHAISVLGATNRHCRRNTNNNTGQRDPLMHNGGQDCQGKPKPVSCRSEGGACPISATQGRICNRNHNPDPEARRRENPQAPPGSTKSRGR